MKPADLRTALQNSQPEPPEGFDARSEQKLVTLLTREEYKVKKTPGLVIAIALILVISMATSLAAFNEDINRLLYQWWPEAARVLRPVNLSMEESGIRLEVLSASVSDENLLVTFSLTDLTGDRINESTVCNGALSGGFYSEASSTTEFLSYNPDIHQAVFAGYTEVYSKYPRSSIQANSNLYLSINDIYSQKSAEVSLFPLMAGKDYTAEAVPFPVSAPYHKVIIEGDVPAPVSKEYPPVLNPENSLDIPLFHDITLSGIGWIDGIMHVQIHNPYYETKIREGNSTSCTHRIMCDYISLYDQEGDWVPFGDPSQYPCHIQNLAWTDGNDSWWEFLFACSPEEADSYILLADFEDQTELFPELQTDSWCVEFPASIIQDETDK